MTFKPCLPPLLALLWGLCLPVGVLAQDDAAPPAPTPVPTPAPASAPAAMASGPNALTQAALQQGVFACLGRVQQVSSFLGYSAQAGALLMAPATQPDQRVLPMSMEIPVPTGGGAAGSAYVSVTFAPGQANGCGASYDAVSYWPLQCNAVAAKAFAGLKRVGQLKRDITVLDGGPTTKVFLMPAGSGCVVIKKEVVL